VTAQYSSRSRTFSRLLVMRSPRTRAISIGSSAGPNHHRLFGRNARDATRDTESTRALRQLGPAKIVLIDRTCVLYLAPRGCALVVQLISAQRGSKRNVEPLSRAPASSSGPSSSVALRRSASGSVRSHRGPRACCLRASETWRGGVRTAGISCWAML